MRIATAFLLFLGTMHAASTAMAQFPPGGPGLGGGPAGSDDLVARMLAFDKDKDGSLTRAEVTDQRLLRLFDRADADKDGVVTRAELTALSARERGNGGRGGPGFGPPGGGPGGPGMMGMPRPGEVLPPMLQQRLNLTADQKSQVADLQKMVDAKLATILDDDQKAQLKEMRQRRPGGPPPGGGPPPPGGPPE